LSQTITRLLSSFSDEFRVRFVALRLNEGRFVDDITELPTSITFSALVPVAQILHLWADGHRY